MATEQDYQRLRRDIGSDATQLTDVQAEEIFLEAAEQHDSEAAIHAATRVIALQSKLAQSADEVSYTANNAAESLSDRFKNLNELLAMWQARLDKAVAEEEAADAGGPVVPPTSVSTLRRRW